MIFPQEEDFGIVAVEALASGTPVVAFRVGGALDIVQENVNGVFFDTQDVTAVKQAIIRLQKHAFVPSKVAATAEQFSHAEFERKLRDFIDTVVPGQ